MRRPYLALSLAALALPALAACGSSGGGIPANATSCAPVTEATNPAASVAVPFPAVTGLPDNPKIAKPKGSAPTALQIKDLKVGAGCPVTATDTITANYTGVTWSTGETFDSTYDAAFGHKTPAQFPLSGVIPGWQQGIPGMKVGGTRELVIPAALAYGPSGSPPKIGPNESLVFVVTLVSVP